MRFAAVLAGLAILALPLSAQSRSKLKSELRKMETAAKDDVDAMVAAASWARDNGLAADAKRIFEKVLRADPDNETANRALGNERFEGQWMPAEKAEEMRRKARQAEFKEAGLVEVRGVWVEKRHVEDAEKGIFHDGEDLVSLEEKLALQSGKVRHPVTGQLIREDDLAQASAGRFRVGTEDRWGSEEDANQWHSSASRPWIVRTHYCTLVGTLPLKTLLDLRLEVDRGFEKVEPMLGFRRPHPANRPVIFVAEDSGQYQQFGDDHGDEGSAYGAFLASEPRSIEGLGQVFPAFCVWDENWGPYYTRHAAGLAYLHAVCVDLGIEVPLWFLRGAGSLASRFYNNYVAGFFGNQHIEKGGVKDLAGFLGGFEISGDQTPADNAYNVYQAGLLLSYAMDGGNADAMAAMKAVTEAFQSGQGVKQAIGSLEKIVIAHEDGVRAHLQKLVQDKDR